MNMENSTKKYRSKHMYGMENKKHVNLSINMAKNT